MRTRLTTLRIHTRRRLYWLLAALLLAVTFVVASTYVRDMAAASARIDGRSLLAETDCGVIEYASIGNGPPVLVVHGAGGGFDQGLLFAPLLDARGFRVVSVSRFGYLRTPLPVDASAEAQADAHACLLDALAIEQIAVLGASAGAPSALQLALRHPERVSALVLLVPALYVPREGDAAPVTTPRGTQFLFDVVLRSDLLFWSATRLARTTLIRAILATPPEQVAAASTQERERVQQTIDSLLPISRRRLGLLNDAEVTRRQPRYPLEQVRVPTLAISAIDDQFGTWDIARYTAKHIPGARFLGYPDGGHVLVGHREQLGDDLAAFLREPSISVPVEP